MRIWQVPSAFFPDRGGVEEVTLQLSKELQRRGHTMLVAVHRKVPEIAIADQVEGIAVARLAFGLPGGDARHLLVYPVSLARQVGHLAALGPRPDLIHVQCASSQLPAVSLYAQRYRVPVVLSTHGEVTMDANQIYQRSAQMRLSLKLGSRLASALTACSRRAGDDAATIAPRFRGCAVVPNGVDLAQWTVTPLPARPVYAAWGRHVPQKGLDLLIDAFAEVRRTLPDAVLRIGGAGPQTQKLRNVAGEGVEFLGPLDRAGVQELLSGARVVAVPSRLEPFGIVALEAMAAGRAVVWSTSGGLADATGGLGWAVDPTDRRALARALLAAHDRPLDPERTRRHAETLSWSRVCDRYEEIYSEASRSATAL